MSFNVRGCINSARKFLQVAPVDADGYLFDVDPDSEAYITKTLTHWDESITPSITWTLADDREVELTKAQLMELWSKAGKAQFERGLAIHKRSRELKEISNTLKRSDLALNSDHWDITRSLTDILADQ